MSYEYQKVQNVGVGRASLNTLGSTTIHQPSVNNSNSVQVTVLGGHIDVTSAGGADTRIHLKDQEDDTELYTVGGAAVGAKQLPELPNVVKTKNGNKLGLEVEGTSCEVVASVYVGEEF